MPRSTTISIRSAISSPARFTNKGAPPRWPSGAPSRPNRRLGLRLLRPTQTTCRCSDKARDGTLRVLKAARDAGVKRVVMTSSTSAIIFGRGVREKPFTEADWTDESNRDDTSPYHRAKTIAERAAWAWLAAEGGGLELVTVNPGLVLGPVLGSDFSASIEAIKKLMDGSIPALPRFGFNVVDVRDIARLHVLAMTTLEAAGERFAGSGDFYWMSHGSARNAGRSAARVRRCFASVAHPPGSAGEAEC